MLNVAVIGAGGVGTATARFLAQAGHSVTVFEQFTLDHDQGSSYGESRIIRRTYADALYTRMMTSAYPLWEELERASGEALWTRCGGLTFGRQGNPAMAQTEEALKVNSVPYERLGSPDIIARFPAFHLTEDHYAIFQEDTGFLNASRCVRTQMRLAQEARAMLHENMPVTAIRPVAEGHIGVRAAGQEQIFQRVLVTAGPWMADLLSALTLPLTVTQQYYAYLPASTPADFAIGTFPVWIDLDTNFYGFPQQNDRPGVKLACHAHGRPVHPDRVPREPDNYDRQPLMNYAATHLPGLGSPPLNEKICLYTNTPDEDFIIDQIPHLPGAFLGSGCSGHGFKFTVLLGKILADLVSEGTSGFDLSRFRLDRFSH